MVAAFGIVCLSLAFLITAVGGLGLRSMNELNFEARNIRAQQWKDVQLSSEALDYSIRNNQINIRIFLSVAQNAPLDNF
jgi:hypothetical protein